MSNRPFHVFTQTIGAATGQPGTLVSASPATVVSIPTTPRRDGYLAYLVTADADGVGALDGVFTIEYSNSTQLEIDRGQDVWATYTPNAESNAAAKAIPAIALTGGAAISHLLELVHVAVDRLRIKFVRSAGSGVIYATVNV